MAHPGYGNVISFNIPVDDSLPVGVLQAVEHLGGEVMEIGQGKLAVVQYHPAKGFALHKRHHEEIMAVFRLRKINDNYYVRMLKLRLELYFPLESADRTACPYSVQSLAMKQS